MDGILMFVVLATLCEAAWETFKMFWQEGKFSWDRLGAMLIAVLVAVGTGADAFKELGYPLQIPYLGIILTGLLMSRGANFMHEILTGVQGLTTKVNLNNKDMQRYLTNLTHPQQGMTRPLDEVTVTTDPVCNIPSKTVPDDGKVHISPFQCTYDEAQITETGVVKYEIKKES